MQSESFLNRIGECAYCKKTNLVVQECTVCHYATYCSPYCMKAHSYTHSNKCKGKVMPSGAGMVGKGEGNRKGGPVGLSNIGNSCYMNSCLQCLANTEQITKYFLSEGSYEKELNKNSDYGSGGKLVEAYANLIQSIWEGNKEYYTLTELKSAIAKVNPSFARYTQEDAYEFYYTFIGTMEEDLNRIK